MLTNTRVATKPDVGRIAQALRTPGIDPRTWGCYGQVTEVVVDPTEGVFLGVDLNEAGVEYQETARYAPIYSGAGFGLYLPIDVGDEVFCSFADGDPNAGIVATSRPWSAASPPPSQINNGGTPSPDIWLIAKTGANIRMVTLGAGNVVFDLQGTGKVGVGGDPGSSGMEPMVLGQTLQSFFGNNLPDVTTLIGWLQTLFVWASTPGNTTVPFPGGPPPAPPVLLATKGEVK